MLFFVLPLLFSSVIIVVAAIHVVSVKTSIVLVLLAILGLFVFIIIFFALQLLIS